jgi:hypothetical protein
MSDPIRELYRQLIVEHGKHPHHRGALAHATHAATVDNPMCGDVVTLQLVVDGDRITEVAHDGHGCALSIAASSVLADRLIDLSLDSGRSPRLPVCASFARDVRARPYAVAHCSVRSSDTILRAHVNASFSRVGR